TQLAVEDDILFVALVVDYVNGNMLTAIKPTIMLTVPCAQRASHLRGLVVLEDNVTRGHLELEPIAGGTLQCLEGQDHLASRPTEPGHLELVLARRLGDLVLALG